MIGLGRPSGRQGLMDDAGYEGFDMPCGEDCKNCTLEECYIEQDIEKKSIENGICPICGGSLLGRNDPSTDRVCCDTCDYEYYV